MFLWELPVKPRSHMIVERCSLEERYLLLQRSEMCIVSINVFLWLCNECIIAVPVLLNRECTDFLFCLRKENLTFHLLCQNSTHLEASVNALLRFAALSLGLLHSLLQACV